MPTHARGKRLSTLAKVEAEIERLHLLAEELKVKERQGVIERIREAIDHYDLTEADLFSRQLRLRGKQPARYAYNGQTWSGIGKMPLWLKAVVNDKTTLEHYRL